MSAGNRDRERDRFLLRPLRLDASAPLTRAALVHCSISLRMSIPGEPQTHLICDLIYMPQCDQIGESQTLHSVLLDQFAPFFLQ